MDADPEFHIAAAQVKIGASLPGGVQPLMATPMVRTWPYLLADLDSFSREAPSALAAPQHLMEKKFPRRHGGSTV